MSKISNIMLMLSLLSNGRKYTICELSERLEVTDRMIRVYKEDLEKAGIFINSIKGKYGGYILDTKVKLPNISFSKYDLELLNKGYDLLKENKKFGLNDEYLGLINKVNGIYKTYQELGSNYKFENNEDRFKYNIFSKAIKEKRKVKIDYSSINYKIDTRIIHPTDMYFYNNEWFVTGFCELRNDVRHFGIERITNYEILDETF